ncbi:hypothetical protein ACE1OC_09205 [Streptomyces sp. DSM 116496]
MTVNTDVERSVSAASVLIAQVEKAAVEARRRMLIETAAGRAQED